MERVQGYGRRAAQKARLRITQPSSWKLPKQSSSIAPSDVWTNSDMDPVPPERRTWGRGAFVTYWVSDLVTISTWSSGSAIITLGMLEQSLAREALLILPHRSFCHRCRLDYLGGWYLQCYSHRLQRCDWCQPPRTIPDCFTCKSWVLV